MHSNKVVLDRESFKALSSETRISILKALDGNRMTVTQLSEKLSISKPALLKHMDALIEAKLISKEERERKWIYYDLTFKGKNVLHPERVAVTVLLSAAAISIAGAIFGFLMYLTDTATRYLSPEDVPGPTTEAFGDTFTGTTAQDPTFLIIGIVLVIVFSALLALAIIVKKKWAKPRF